MKIQNFNIVTTFLALWLAVSLASKLEDYMAYFFILSIGILHGSNDIRIISKVQENQKTSKFKSLLGYISVVLLGTLLFYFIPAAGLLIFIGISGFHFGEQHFSDLKSDNKILKFLFYTSYGCFIIFLLLFANSVEAIAIINDISHVLIGKSSLTTLVIVSGLILLLSSFYFVFKGDLKKWYKELFFLLVFLIVFNTASLLWSFAIYFVLWHSLPSLIDQIQFLYGNISKGSILNYLKTSFIYWFVSVAGLFLVFTYLVVDQDLFLAIFFSFLAAITFPHVLVMNRIFKT